MMFLGRPLVRWHEAGTLKLVADGNSITDGGHDGAGSVDGVPGYVFRNIAPFSAQALANVAIGGQNTDAMISNAADVDSAFDAAKKNVLFAQEGTNQNETTDPLVNFEKLKNYVISRRSSRAWVAVVVATAPPAYLGDSFTQEQTTAWNIKLDEFNVILRARWAEFADTLIETRAAGSPYDQARYPDYLRSTFFSSTVINGISNNAAWTNEGNQIRIHYSAAGIALLAPFYASALLRCPIRIRP